MFFDLLVVSDGLVKSFALRKKRRRFKSTNGHVTNHNICVERMESGGICLRKIFSLKVINSLIVPRMTEFSQVEDQIFPEDYSFVLL